MWDLLDSAFSAGHHWWIWVGGPRHSTCSRTTTRSSFSSEPSGIKKGDFDLIATTYGFGERKFLEEREGGGLRNDGAFGAFPAKHVESAVNAKEIKATYEEGILGHVGEG